MLARTLLFALVPAFASSALAGTRYVDVAASGANDGSSWSNAFSGVDGLANALAVAVAGDQLWVAQGTYKPTAGTSRSVAILLKTGVEIYGGFAGGESSLAQRDVATHVTVLSGDLGGDDASNVFTDNSFHVLNGAGTNATAVLDGFTVRGGNANTSGGNNDRGGGILLVSGSSPTVRRCLFQSNRCTFGGGAGYVNSSSPAFTDCTFDGNIGGSFGGAFDQATNVGTVFTRCVFSGNSAARAGAIEIFGSSTVKVYGCLFFGNTATGSTGGGAMYISGSTPSIRDCSIVRNLGTAAAAAGILSASSTVELANSIVYFNTGPGGAQNLVNQVSGTVNASYSCVQGGIAGTGNQSADPQLASVAGNDYRLTIASPCIDAGNNATVAPGAATDLDGNPRLTDEPTVADTGAGSAPIVDMGAYEFPAPIVTTYCFGDGFGTGCPCGNNTAFGNEEGCLNSLGVGGKLVASGVARINADTLVLQGSQMPNASALYFQGTTQVSGGNGTVFGDGLRCAGGTVIRLGTKFNAAGASQYPAGGDPSVSVKGLISVPGGRTYQVWYRNAASFCQPETFNLTDALSIAWVL